MKKLVKRYVSIMMASLMVCPLTSYAAVNHRQAVEQEFSQETVLLPETEKMSVGQKVAVGRSKALASAMCSITNTEKGILHIYAETLMFQSVDWAGLTVYLDKWDEKNQIWGTVETFEKEFTPEDTEDGDLHRAAISVDVGTQPSGYYYRARCIHQLEYDGGWFEAKATETDGVLLTNIYK